MGNEVGSTLISALVPFDKVGKSSLYSVADRRELGVIGHFLPSRHQTLKNRIDVL